MAQTAEERKIKRLEAEVKRLKEKVAEQDKLLHWKESALYSEREWRRNFQKLLKEAVLEDTVTEHKEFY
jgi:hypothetical protein